MVERNHHLSLEGVSFGAMTRDEADRMLDEHSKMMDLEIGEVGAVTAAKLLKEFGDLEGIADAPAHKLASVENVSEKMAVRINERMAGVEYE